MSQVYYTRNSSGLTVFMDGRSTTLSSEHPNYDKVLRALREKRFAALPELMNVAVALEKRGVSSKSSQRRVYVQGGKVWYSLDGRRQQLDGTLVKEIVSELHDGFRVDNLLNFQEKLLRNKLESAQRELYDWMKSGRMVICEDGDFLAYKKVRHDYKDIYTGKVDNSPGKKLPRLAYVDPNRHNHCSVGYHFCSLGYLSHYSSNGSEDRVMIVKINPADVVAIPTDYNHQKGRCYTYEVIGEYKGDWRRDAFTKTFVRDGELEKSVRGTEFTPDYAAADDDLYQVLMDGTVRDMWTDLRQELVDGDGRIWVYKTSEHDREWTVVRVKRAVSKPEDPITGEQLPYVRGVTVVRQLSVKTKSAAEALKRLKRAFSDALDE